MQVEQLFFVFKYIIYEKAFGKIHCFQEHCPHDVTHERLRLRLPHLACVATAVAARMLRMFCDTD